MKILGEKSLSSKVIVGLNILFSIITIINIAVLSIIIKVVRNIIMNNNLKNDMLDFILYTMIILTGIIALFIIYQFIKIFKNLKNNVLFCKENEKRLNTVSINCFVISILYFIIAVFLIANNFQEQLIYYIIAFSIMLAIIFSVSAIGIKILNEIYKKAIEYKEENDFTI